jgi:hypothetical protein
MLCAMQDMFKIQPFKRRKVHTSRSDMLTFITIARSLQVLQMWFGFQILLLHHIITTELPGIMSFVHIHRTQLHRLGPL